MENLLVMAALVAILGMVVCSVPTRIREYFEVNNDIREAVINGADHVKYRQSTLNHIRKSDRKLKASFRLAAHETSMLGEFWSDAIVDGYGINLECRDDFMYVYEELQEMKLSVDPYDSHPEVVRILRAFEKRFSDIMFLNQAEEERKASYEPYSWLGDFLPEAAATTEQ